MFKKWWRIILHNERGGGDGDTEIKQAPVTPAPDVGQTAEQAMQAQLKYNPQLYAQYAQAYGQYMPQLAETQMGIQQQFAPQLQALQQQMFPQQTQLAEAMSGKALGMMQSPIGYTQEQQAALDAIRARQVAGLQEQLRTRANLGGGLYGGRAQATEQRGVTELEQAFAEQDINRMLQQSQQALSYAQMPMQMAYPQVQQPVMPNYWQGVTPSADAIYQALFQASQPEYAYQQPQASPAWGLAGSLLGGAAGGMTGLGGMFGQKLSG